MYRLLFVVLLSILPTRGLSHGLTERKVAEGLSVMSNLSSSFSSRSPIEQNQLWVVPGFFMGGEALPQQRGFNVSEARVAAQYREGSITIYGKAGYHGHDDAIEWEEAKLGYLVSSSTRVEAGKMKGRFSFANQRHGSDTPFLSYPLSYDIIWGRHYVDDGIRLILDTATLDCGLEGWTGNRFPSQLGDDGKGAYDIYCRKSIFTEQWNLTVGTYYYNGSASRRVDERYTTGHNHGVDAAVIPYYYFSGKTEISGVLAETDFTLGSLKFELQGELMNSESQGDIRDTTRISSIQTRYQGLSGTASAAYHSHRLSFRYDHLRFKNKLEGAAATDLAELAGLIANQDPIAVSFGYQWQANSDLLLKIEWLKSKYISDQHETILAGFSWFHTTSR
ncbi:hypothetical protein [Pseudobacteriovorax antillogorgiicola]|uniref:Phosphate-selective porin O and P n=1 Tax=Pseudobacteriovorax antillogorgiicola TaxID=1513793 RepID=A0A1Y6BT16_9BACT|nr:hypothetical protein [Pseudobacteriovorax antillogorgiicola]TCS53018.1 hypothetical protein EDD56_10869 [Pseudobacteriovorax antillogorgiicola]SMF26898.1 hypothetical protein SAMN06296036_108178 [Pseudobacteriovorax antillogorgiicola]